MANPHPIADLKEEVREFRMRNLAARAIWENLQASKLMRVRVMSWSGPFLNLHNSLPLVD
jgi:hypothetical protein